MTHIRYTPGIEPGGRKQIITTQASVVVVNGDTEIDISHLVREARTTIRHGEVAQLGLEVIGWELA